MAICCKSAFSDVMLLPMSLCTCEVRAPIWASADWMSFVSVCPALMTASCWMLLSGSEAYWFHADEKLAMSLDRVGLAAGGIQNRLDLLHIAVLRAGISGGAGRVIVIVGQGAVGRAGIAGDFDAAEIGRRNRSS